VPPAEGNQERTWFLALVVRWQRQGWEVVDANDEEGKTSRPATER
jgi:hypothetical protein